MKIAMWSGPRNLSTAMMYSFGNRVDMTVWDEPFYAAYLAATGVEHPMRDEVLAAGQTDAQAVADAIAESSGPLFMKLMNFHMQPGFPFDWADDCVHVHLLRHPARVIASYALKRDKPTIDDLGFLQQQNMFDRFPGPVISSFDIRRQPEEYVRRLCEAIGLPFDESMLSWPAGPKHFDGVWAAHWYDAVHRSTGFAGAEEELPELSGELADLLEQALPAYEALYAHKL